ncbi:GMP synthase (glutamine-hydrolyzing) [Sporothrix schenckii 1099-18]|uniref:GMP synthase (glutamine-hydrolyzing) n=1 Tax=Sporothrix schenckii 1099-18 TaxID=1397361 RepID=A0A0F2LYF8_SPOSC|nr:GMP synthase (glutamine-hydrolyzing) [Sporothrix schenckii 1099-18]KJR81520.1 GMP synthase (glutamine-hydrolysing) [Sporothrix schenckii 1099-18]
MELTGVSSYGCQELAWQINSANVARGEAREYGHADVTIHKVDDHVDRLFAGLGETMHAYMSHFDKLVSLPEGFVIVASTSNSEFAGIAHKEKAIFGVQFHPELEHTPRGSELLRNFSVDICGANPSWVMGDFVEQEIARIRHLVGDRAQVIGAVSGGVDSTVAAKLMKEAIGDRFHAVLVDNGLMRLNECQQVKATLGEHLGINLTVVDAADLFLGRLAGVLEPEKKRKIIGSTCRFMGPTAFVRSTLIDLFEKEAERIEKEAENTPNAGKVEWFLQGTLYPDVIESLSFKGPSATIKTHHNVGGLPERMMNGQGLRLLEPLRLLFKDEVRAIGRTLNIHNDLIMRHPFPGPGIGIRILGEVTPERVEVARKADNIYISMIKEAGIYDKMSQAYAGVDTNKAVGVMGDTRVYGYIIMYVLVATHHSSQTLLTYRSLRAVTTSDFMSAEAFEFPWALLQKIARTIVNSVDGVSRVTYDLTSKPPGTIELE